MLYWDLTNLKKSNHHSGLNRASQIFFNEFQKIIPNDVRPIYWNALRKNFIFSTFALHPTQLTEKDYYFTADVFSELERPGFEKWLAQSPCKKAAIFHDSIPLKAPDITWPNSVKRHPYYLKMLSNFDYILAVSNQSKDELSNYWDLINIPRSTWPKLGRMQPGANSCNLPRKAPRPTNPSSTKKLLCVGILEPRKGQSEILKACEQLWDESLEFELHLVGRVNPHFGKNIVEKINTLQTQGYKVFHHKKCSDKELINLYNEAYLSIFASQHEGYGLPVTESFWMGLPIISTDIPSIEDYPEYRRAIVSFSHSKPNDLYKQLKKALTTPAYIEQLKQEIPKIKLTTWNDTARKMLELIDF